MTFDCNDAERVAAFWGALTGYALDHVDDPGNPYWIASPQAGGVRLVFVTVPERKSSKNRLHLDLLPPSDEQSAEVDRMLGLGATLVDDRRERTPGGWVVLADPEGNEFCVEPG